MNKIFIISAPSGCGKGSVIRAVRAAHPELISPVSATTRVPRTGETDGLSYYFMTVTRFMALHGEGAFAETVYLKPNFYGTLFRELEKLRDGHLITDVDVNGALAIKERYRDRAVLIMLAPPSMEELERRLRGRNDTPEAEIPLRLNRASDELAVADKFDYIVINDDLDTAVSEVLTIIQDHIMK